MNKEELDHSLENSITLNDLVMVRNIINVASKRGAFSAEEFSDIGTVYNKIDEFLKLHLKINEEDDSKGKKTPKEKKGKKNNNEKDEKSSESENKIEI